MGKIKKKGKTALSFLLAMLMLSSIIPLGIITTAAFSSNGTKANPYLISTAEDLVDFRDKVNSGETSVCATLTQNIDLNTGIIFNFDGTYSGDTPNIWTPIGTNENVYCGKFDGAGYTVSGIYIEDSTMDYSGLFGCTGSAAIVSNVGVENSYFNGNNYVGGICGENSGYIENCYNTGVISANSRVGGICGENSGTVSNCYNTGNVTGTETEQSIGGVCGCNSASGTVQNSYFNCDRYFGSAVGSIIDSTVCEDVLGKTTEQFASGEVAYLLNGLTSEGELVWGQELGVEITPVFGGKTVYYDLNCNGNYCYSNETISSEHSFQAGKCIYCGLYQTMGRPYGHSITLDGMIGVNYIMEIQSEYANDSSSMKFTVVDMNYDTGEETERYSMTVPFTSAKTEVIDGKTYYKFTCPVSAKEMTSTIKAQLINGSKQSIGYTYSVAEYAYQLFDESEEITSTEALVAAMLNYGAHSQLYFDYNTDILANYDLADSYKALPYTQADELKGYKNSYIPNESYTGNTEYYGSSLVLKTGTYIKHYFKYNPATTNINNLICTDDSGNNYEITKSGSYIYVKVDNIPAHKLGEDITLLLYEDGVQVGKINYSAISYVYTVLSTYTADDGTNDNLRNIAKALYQYYLNAYNYVYC